MFRLSYLAAENDLNVCVRGVRLLMKLARTEPLKAALELPGHSIDTDSMFWPGDADPDKVKSSLHRTRQTTF